MPILPHLQKNLRACLAPPWPLLVVAFSGGRDSVALLHGLAQLQKQYKPGDGWEFALLAAHFNHGLRGAESDGDETFCRDFCAQQGIEFVCDRAADLVGGGENKARERRYAWLNQVCDAEQAKGYQPVWLVCAHHQEDQAETVLLHLLRGSGTAGLAAMRRQNGRLLRPLLTASREEIESYLAAHNLNWREDSTNAGLDYTRNRLRHLLLPLLKEFNPRVNLALAQTAEVAAAETDFLQEYAQQRMQQAMLDAAEGAAAYPLALWQKEPLAIQRLLVRLLWQAARQRPVCSLSFEQTEAVVNLPLHKTIHLLGGVAAVKNDGWLKFFCLPSAEMSRRRAKSRGGYEKYEKNGRKKN